MALTNPDSLLDKNGLAYYHSKVKQYIKDAISVTVNVTQSEHQLIYWNFNNYEFGMVASDIDISDPTQYSSQYGNLVSSVAKCGQIFSIGILPDNGYNRGDFTISIDGELLVEGQDYQVEGNEVHGLEVPLGSTINISATPATVTEPEPSPVEYNVTFNYDIPTGYSVGITFNLPNGDTSTYNFTGTGTQTISLPEGTTYNSNMTSISGYSPTPSNGRIRGTVSQDTEITFGYTANECSYTVSFQYSSGGSAATTYKVYVNNTLVQSSGGTSAVVTGYYGDNFRVEIDPIEGYTTSMPTVTGTLGSGSQKRVLFTANTPIFEEPDSL